MQYGKKLREKAPRILNITNDVAANFNANGLLMIGASPAMANMAQEVRESAKRMDAVICNTGALTEERAEAMYVAGMTANKAGVPVVLDPVAIGTTTFRTNYIKDLLSEVQFAAIRGNAGEISVLGGVTKQTCGPDNILEANDPMIAKFVAKKYQTTVISTGKTDVITDGKRITICQNGHEILERITASGCTLSGIVGAYISIADGKEYQASVEAVTSYNIAAEIAASKVDGPGDFSAGFLNELYKMTEVSYEKYKCVLSS